MPLTRKGKKIKKAMEKQYGKEKGEKKTITGTHLKRKKK